MSSRDSVYFVYLCQNCDNWHAQWHGLLDDDCTMAGATRQIGKVQEALGVVATPGLLIVGGDLGDGRIASIFQDGAVARATLARTAIPEQLEALIERGDVLKAFELLAEQGTASCYVHDDWAAILKDLLGGEPAQEVLSSDDLAKLWER